MIFVFDWKVDNPISNPIFKLKSLENPLRTIRLIKVHFSIDYPDCHFFQNSHRTQIVSKLFLNHINEFHFGEEGDVDHSNED